MGYKTRKSIIQGSRFHKDLELAYGLDSSAMSDGRPKHSAFQKPKPTESLEKAMDSGMPKEAVENMGYDTSALPKYGPYKSEHVKMDTPMNFLGRIKNFNNKDAGNLAKGLLGPVKVKGDKTKEVKSKVKIETSKENRDQGLQGFEITYTDGTTKKVLEGKA